MRREITPARWQEVERVYHGARELTGPAREAFLSAECGRDAAVRQEVESLLAFEGDANEYLERPAVEVAARTGLQRESLPAGHHVGGYEILGLLGSGGMGEVYRARDVRLERDVALKVLDRTVVADPAWVLRFEEEARAASGLAHPNIVTIYGVGEDGDHAYIAMELVPGRTLREMLASGGVGVEAVVEIGAQVADALAAAHAAGIVHRDLKPENLMVTPDWRLKVLDFGIAKRRTRPNADTAQGLPLVADGVTQRGLILGTVGYMSPEQAEGQPVDHRSDQFSLGAVLYELLTGTRAFERETRTATLQALRQADLRALHPWTDGLPSALPEVVRRCLARRPEDRYADTADLALELRRIRDAFRNGAAGRVVTRRQILWLGGAAALSAAAGVVAWRGMPAAPTVRSLVVLPFANVEDKPDIEYLCDGITESLIRRVGYVPGLEVRPRSAVFNFKGSNVAPVDAGRRLRADAVLTGAVAKEGIRIVVTASLVDVASGSVTWEGRYDRPAADLPALQHDLAVAIVDEGIRRPLVARNRRQFDQQPTENAEALDLFLRGVYEHRQGGEARYLAARRLLAQAVAKDPAFALAHVSLASTFTVMTIDGFERPTAAWPESNRSIRRALEIDPGLPEAHAEQASAWFFFDHDWSAAEREWTSAVTSGPSPALPDLLSGAAIKIWALGRTAEALAMARRARSLDPLTAHFGVLEGDLLLHDGQAGEAARVYEEALARSPHDASACFGLAEARRMLGQYDAAIAALRRGHENASESVPPPIAAVSARARGEAGFREVERVAVALELEALEANQAQGAYVSPLDLARGYARAGDADRAFRHLDAAFEERSPGLVFLKVDRAWATVRPDARFAAAVRAVGLP